jgi:hypothetical protein
VSPCSQSTPVNSIFKLLNQIHPLTFCSFTTELVEKYNIIRHKQTCYNSVHSYLWNINKSNLLGSSWSHKSWLKYYILILYHYISNIFLLSWLKLRTTAVWYCTNLWGWMEKIRRSKLLVRSELSGLVNARVLEENNESDILYNDNGLMLQYCLTHTNAHSCISSKKSSTCHRTTQYETCHHMTTHTHKQ